MCSVALKVVWMKGAQKYGLGRIWAGSEHEVFCDFLGKVKGNGTFCTFLEDTLALRRKFRCA